MGTGWTSPRRWRSAGFLTVSGMPTTVLLCHLDELPNPGSRGFGPIEEGGIALFIVRRGNTVHAYRDTCPHQGARMAWRRNAYLNRAGDRIVCHAHGAQFDLESGECLLGPCLGKFLTAMAITVSASGEIHLVAEQGKG